MPVAMAPGAPRFAAFGEDEDACKHAGAAAIATETDDATRAHRYDDAYQRCMFARGRMRAMQSMADGPPPEQRENLHSFAYPDAFYSIPYATPGYGYDGFSY